MLQPPTNDRKTKAEASSKTTEQFLEQEQSLQLLGGMGRSRQSQPLQQRENLAALQKAYGNQAVLRMNRTQKSRAPEKLPVTSYPLSQGGILQRKSACGNMAGSSGTCAECQKKQEMPLQRKNQGKETVNEVPPIVHEVLSSSGQPLESETRAFMESRFGQDFSQVRVHTDAKAAESARGVNALAYTVGRDVVFGGGQFSPRTTTGTRLLAHELTHTIQQQQGKPTIQSSLKLAHNNSRQEEEADDVANSVVQGQPTNISQFYPSQLARQTAMDGGVDENAPRDAGLPGGVETPAPQPENSSGGGGGGIPSVPDCTTVMGGRGINYYGLGLIFNHTYVNFKENTSDYWLIEGGPLPSDPKTSGAWAKHKNWENDGNRKQTTWSSSDCPKVKKLLFDTQTIYDSKALPYDATKGPNSNSFAEHLTFKAGVPSDFHYGTDKAYDYWQSRTRPS